MAAGAFVRYGSAVMFDMCGPSDWWAVVCWVLIRRGVAAGAGWAARQQQKKASAGGAHSNSVWTARKMKAKIMVYHQRGDETSANNI